MMKSLILVMAGLTAVMISGCGSVPEIDNIVKEEPAPVEGYDKYKIVVIRITSDMEYTKDTQRKPFGDLEIDFMKSNYGLPKEDFRAALERKIKNLGFNDSLSDLSGQDTVFNLQVDIEYEDIPMVGSDFHVVFKVHYRLTDAQTSDVLYDDTLLTGGKAEFKEDILVAINRLNHAIERAAALNIREFAGELKEVMEKKMAESGDDEK